MWNSDTVFPNIKKKVRDNLMFEVCDTMSVPSKRKTLKLFINATTKWLFYKKFLQGLQN